MFHWRENIYWGRRWNGSVRLVKLSSGDVARHWLKENQHRLDPNGEIPAHVIVFDFVIPSAEWCSIVSSVSIGGETGRYVDATHVHNELPCETAR